jgi:gamma-glutamyltranspeptidase / glutathione hydrolase
VCPTRYHRPTVCAFDRIAGRTFASRSEVLAPHAMAATSQPLATQAAVAVLRDGGSAVDAAIAANAMLGLVEPTGAGIGGDLFALVWDPGTRTLHGLNGSGRSPASLTLERFRELGLSRIPPLGPLPVSVPGAVDGWIALHGRFGRLPMERLLAPAIGYAREGFPVSEVIAWQWARNVPYLERFPNFKETFAPHGRAPRKGERFRNPDLARTLETIAREGRDAFYRGPIARAIDLYMKRNGGFLSADDMAAHASTWVEPVSTTYRGHEVWELPPNGQGIAVLQMLNLLEGYDLAGMGFGSADHVHTLVEVTKLAFADRARWYADPDFHRVPPLPIAELISKDYAVRRRSEIDSRRAALTRAPGNPLLTDGDTVYLATADAAGGMVSLIQSNYRGMGSGMTPDGLGFVLQDRGELFDLTEGRPNSYAPGKRPFHTIIPGFLTRKGEPVAAFGVMGGAFQPQGQVQILVNLLDFGMNLQEAGDAPRILHEGSSEPTGERMTDGGQVSLESGFSWETIRELLARGHHVGWNAGDYGGYQAIRWDSEERVYCGASESRKDGQAAGF